MSLRRNYEAEAQADSRVRQYDERERMQNACVEAPDTEPALIHVLQETLYISNRLLDQASDIKYKLYRAGLLTAEHGGHEVAREPTVKDKPTSLLDMALKLHKNLDWVEDWLRIAIQTLSKHTQREDS